MFTDSTMFGVALRESRDLEIAGTSVSRRFDAFAGKQNFRRTWKHTCLLFFVPVASLPCGRYESGTPGGGWSHGPSPGRHNREPKHDVSAQKTAPGYIALRRLFTSLTTPKRRARTIYRTKSALEAGQPRMKKKENIRSYPCFLSFLCVSVVTGFALLVE